MSCFLHLFATWFDDSTLQGECDRCLGIQQHRQGVTPTANRPSLSEFEIPRLDVTCWDFLHLRRRLLVDWCSVISSWDVEKMLKKCWKHVMSQHITAHHNTSQQVTWQKLTLGGPWQIFAMPSSRHGLNEPCRPGRGSERKDAQGLFLVDVSWCFYVVLRICQETV